MIINATTDKNRRKKSRKTRRPRDLKALGRKKRPTAWLRSLISPLDFGLKVRMPGPGTETVSRPVHCNTNAEILDAFRNGAWYRIERLSNRMLDEHWNDQETYYFVADGSTKTRFILVNIDIDCHAQGTERGAAEAAEYLKANFFLDLYHEPSTNGEGRHGYFILDKWELGAEYVKTILKHLERHLNNHLLAQGFDIELCEIKGLPPVVLWGEDDTISNYRAGILAKIPRQVERFEEWKKTTTLTHWDVQRLVSKIRAMDPAEVPTTPKPTTAKAIVETPTRGSVKGKATTKARVTGSMPGKVIGEGELAQLEEGGHYRKVASTLLGTHTLKTTGRTVVTSEDVALFLLCLKFFTGRMNADGTLPVKRFKGLWSALYDVGDVGRSFDCHRFKAIRDYLSGLGLLDWEDNMFVAPRGGRDGGKLTGRACKWKAGEVLMDMLDWERGEVLADEAQDRDRVDEAQGEVVQGGRGGEAPLVGTGSSSCPPPPFDTLAETIRSLSRLPDGEEIRPMEAVPAGRDHPRLYTPEEVTRLVMSFEESMEQLAA